MKYLLSIIFSLAILTSCSKETDSEVSSFIFGSYYGECYGNCATFYNLQDASLYPDDIEYFTHTLSELKFKNEALSNSKFQLAKTFEDQFPSELLLSTQTTFGIPDAYDQGGYFIAKINNSDTLSWNIDTNRDVLPEYLKNYMDLLDQLLLDLQ